MSGDKIFSWKEIHKFYSDKKSKWSNTTSCYGNRTNLWGNESSHSYPDGRYGFELLPPYTDNEIDVYEDKMMLKLPSDLRLYLTHVSRELHTDSYPIVFKLDTDYNIGLFQLPPETDMWNFGEKCFIHTDPDTCPDDCDFDPCEGMITIENGGCTDQRYIVIKGNEIGSIWRNGCGGDSLFRDRGTTFYDFITKPICRDLKFKQNDANTSNDMSLTFQFLRIMSGFGRLNYTN
jgi:hypothetical protein